MSPSTCSPSLNMSFPCGVLFRLCFDRSGGQQYVALMSVATNGDTVLQMSPSAGFKDLEDLQEHHLLLSFDLNSIR